MACALTCLLAILALGLDLDAGPPATGLQPVGRFDRGVLPEASGIVKSRRYPGTFWVHNDSGNAPMLFAVRRDGQVIRAFRLAVPNVDWEDIAADDCGHLFLGDIGNNGGRLPIRAIYRFDEPDPKHPSADPLPATGAWFYRFPEGHRFDAEGLFIPPGRDEAIVISKRFDGEEAELFSVSLEKPAPLLRAAIPQRIGTLPGFVEPATGASLTADGRSLAVCSETATRVYRLQPDTSWRLAAEVAYLPAPVEGVTWDGPDLLLVSEGRGIDLILEPLRPRKGKNP